jgi:hypothetical protein
VAKRSKTATRPAGQRGATQVDSLSQRREARSRGRQAAAAARRRQQRIRNAILIGVAILAAAVAGVFIVREVTAPEPERITTGLATPGNPGQLITDQGGGHVNTNADVDDYNSDPPTSGRHWPNPAPWGVANDEIADEQQVHNLEHGGIVMQYDCDLVDDCDALVAQLTPLATQFPVKLILAPRDNMVHAIAVTAWTRLLTLDQFDEAAIQAFIDAYVDQGPEKIQSETDLLNQSR